MNKKIILFASTLFLLSALFFSSEGAMVSATTQTASTTPTSTLSFDVNLVVTSELSLTCPTAVTMSSISGLTGGTSFSVASCNVKTNSTGGYLLYVKASSTPALVNNSNPAYYFDDYSTTTPEYTWTVGAASSSFGFSVSSTGVVAAFKNDGATCGGGTTSTYSNCFRSFSTSNINIASKVSTTDVNGVNTDIGLKAEVGTTRNQQTGTYVAGITVTAVAQ